MVQRTGNVVCRAVVAAASMLLASMSVNASDPLVVVVMDPLSKPLSCDCVRGYAQRERVVTGPPRQ